MNKTLKRIFVFGFPGNYGGAVTEMHHQILLWLDMGVEVHLIPAWNPAREPLYTPMRERGVIIHAPLDWSALSPQDAILGFCSQLFLSCLPDILPYTRRTVSLGCMTWLMDEEKRAMRDGEVALFLFQNEEVRQLLQPRLQALNPQSRARFITFRPYFHHDDFPFIGQRSSEHFGCGRISRQDADKFARNTLCIYEYFVSPKPKKGLFLGFDGRSAKKIGKPYDWIRTAQDQREVSQQDFYKHCEIVLQPTDTTENWPRIGLESMSSGSVLIVDNRGGWQQMVEHGRTGWLCDNERDFIYYASKMAYEPHLRDDMAHAARQRLEDIGGLPASTTSWEAVLEAIDNLPE